MRLLGPLTQPLSFPYRLRNFLANGVKLDDCEAELRASIATRATRFMALLGESLDKSPEGPYATLLRHAGAQLEDIREAVAKDGLEAALAALAEAGVYLTAHELKGKEDALRGSLRFRINPEDIRLTHGGFESQSSGSNNKPQRATVSFRWLAQETPATGAFILANSLHAHRHAAFEPIIPGVAGMMYMLKLARLGIACEKWFARAIPFSNAFEQAYFTIIARELSLVGTLSGPGFARPETIESHQLDRIVRWITDSRAQGHKTCVRTVASNAARVAGTAMSMGVSLNGVTFMASGEPMTDAKRRLIEASGARTTVLYGFEPGGVWVGQGCPDPLHTDEMHVGLNTLAVIASPRRTAYGDASVNPLLFTTLDRSASRFLFNAENGDYAQLSERDCGCLMQRAGLTLHIHGVRSYEKLTSEGLSFPIAELTEIIESRLPREFGGGPYDYQLVEEEGAGAQTMITLRIHPQVGPVDETQALARLIDELGRADKKQRFMTEVWRQTRTFQIKRIPPRTSARGKTLAVHLSVGKEK